MKDDWAIRRARSIVAPFRELDLSQERNMDGLVNVLAGEMRSIVGDVNDAYRDAFDRAICNVDCLSLSRIEP